MRKDILTKKLTRLEGKLAQIVARANASQDVAEVRDLTAQADDIKAEIEETRDELAALEAEAEARQVPPAGAQHKGAEGAQLAGVTAKRADEDYFASMEYRMAFKDYVQKGTPIVRNGEVISTADTGAAIPITVMNEVINTVRKRYGNLYNKVRKLNVKGGVEFPIGALSASFKWINESTVSPRQRVGALDKVSFNYHMAEIRVATTFLANILTIEPFEARVAEVIAVAFLEAMDQAIINGTGNGMPLGIVNDARVAATSNVVSMTAADMASWTQWHKKFFSKLPLGYRSGEFIFPLSTVECYLETMADANNNPVFRQATGLVVNDGDATNPNGSFFGRGISLVEPDIIGDFDAASSGDVVGIFWQPEEYAVNENLAFTMLRYFDQETNEWVDKALVVIDGKVLNPNGIWLIKKA